MQNQSKFELLLTLKRKPLPKITQLFIFSITTDIDECSADSNPCDVNADCTNSDGSYSCTCKQGFTGDGATCQGFQNVPKTHFTMALQGELYVEIKIT